ncbi:MAG: hypothetical protein HYX41_00690 [Bdellovibrio sp.]|nr:hypothetical protein [Bdellovibrio sp.]
MSTQTLAARLDDLIKRGVTQVGTFIPWQAAESDISHALIRFLQASSERKIPVFLILSPELGIHYPNSGLPKNSVTKKENTAAHCHADKVSIHLPPNSFGLPSFFSAEFNKRYYSYLARMDSLFSDLLRNSPSLMKQTTVCLSGSFWKYFRSPKASSIAPFAGPAGDYSAPAALAFRQRVESLYAQREFSDPNAAAANRWKTRAMEDSNRKWFYQHSEDVFRSRSHRTLKKKSAGLKLSELEIFTPEADPSMTYQRFFQMIGGAGPDFIRLSGYLDEISVRASSTDSAINTPLIHWSSLGGFRNLSEPERQFLILKSVLLTATRRGGVLLEDGDWLNLSAAFRSRLESLIRTLTHDGAFQLKSPVLYLCPHLWSGAGTLWEELYSQLGPQTRMFASIDTAIQEPHSHIIIVDPSWILTHECVQKLANWAKAGRLLVLPRSTLYTESAKHDLERLTQNTQKIEITNGLPYSLHAFGDGKIIIYEVPTSLSAKRESLSAWQTFINGVLSIGEIQPVCRTSDARLKVVSYEIPNDSVAVFVLNSSKRPVQADLVFPIEVSISDLGGLFSQQSRKPEGSDLVKANRISLTVPPMGVLPLKVDGLGPFSLKERHLAALNARQTEESALSSAYSELPGLGQNGSLEELWN